MLIIPAIDLHAGKVVRLTQGAFERETVYSASPAQVMERWQQEGASLVHVVDLNGAREGICRNLDSLKKILAVAKIPVQFGGGLRSTEAVSKVLNAGVWRVVVGTKAFDRVWTDKLIQKFKDRIAVAFDIRSGALQIEGWQSSKSGSNPETFCRRLEQAGAKTVICTDVMRDGALKGPNIKLLNQVLRATEMNVIISGGVSNLSDLKRLSQIKARNFEGVIIGKALYERKIALRDALKQLEGKKQ